MLLLVLGGLVLSAALTSARNLPLAHPCGGHERWQVKVLIDAPAAGTVNFAPKWRSIDTLSRLDRPSVPLFGAPRQQPVEFTTYQLRRVYLVEAKTERDDDIHLVIRDRHQSHTMIVEFPDTSCPDTAGSAKVGAMAAARAAFVSACGMPSRSRFIALEGRATIDGVGFFDVKHGTPQRGRADNDIELHPVLRFQSSDCRRP